MNKEYKKCMAGEIYYCHNEVFIEFKSKTRKVLSEYNHLQYDEKQKKYELLKQMVGSVGKNVSIGSPFICDYGCNIHNK